MAAPIGCDALSDAVGSLLAGTPERATIVGSAFAISDEHAVTAFHCVRGEDRSPTEQALWLRLTPQQLLRVHVREWDPLADLALLTIEGPLPEGWRPVPIAAPSDALEEQRVRIEGFPADWTFRDESLRIGGVLRDAGAALAGVPVLGLYSEEVAAGRDPSGYSGGPVRVRLRFRQGGRWLSGWVAVGVVRWGQPVEPDAERKGRGGQVFAAPLTAEWPELAARRVVAEPVTRVPDRRSLPESAVQPRRRTEVGEPCNEHLNAIHGHLVQFIHRSADIALIASQSGLNLGAIDSRGPAVNYWQEVLDRACLEGDARIDAVHDRALIHLKGTIGEAPLREAIQAYRQARG